MAIIYFIPNIVLPVNSCELLTVLVALIYFIPGIVLPVNSCELLTVLVALIYSVDVRSSNCVVLPKVFLKE